MKFASTFCTVLLFICLFYQCQNSPTMSYTYADGNNNSYRITTEKLTYSPMSKEMSSSGTYSGGEPQSLDLSEAQFHEIAGLLDAAIDNEHIRIDKRMMGSGAIMRKKGEEFSRVMIRAFCKEQKAIDSYLKSLLK